MAGLAGVCQVAGSDMTLSMGVAGGVGFTAIIVAWLCQLNPGMILVVSFLFSVLERARAWCRAIGLSADSADVLQRHHPVLYPGQRVFLCATALWPGAKRRRGREVNGYVHQVPGGRGGRGHAALFGTVGEILTEKVGHLNLGVEGMMAIGACAGFMAGYVTDSFAAALAAAFWPGCWRR